MEPKRPNTIRLFPEEMCEYLLGGRKLPAFIVLFDDAKSTKEHYLYTMTISIYYMGCCCDIRSSKCQEVVKIRDLLNNITSQRE